MLTAEELDRLEAAMRNSERWTFMETKTILALVEMARKALAAAAKKEQGNG